MQALALVAALSLAHPLALRPVSQQEAAPEPIALEVPGASQAPAAPDTLFPGATEDLALSWGADSEGLVLLDVVLAYGAVTQQRLSIDKDTQAMLSATSSQLDRPVVVPRAQVQGFFEALLRSSGCALTIDHAAEPRLIGVHSLYQSSSRNTLRSRAMSVEQGDLDLLRRHPAMLFSTQVHVPHLDARQLTNSIRTLIVDANTQQVLPLGSESAVHVLGFGPMVADMVQGFEQLDAFAAASIEPMVHELFRLEHANAEAIAGLVSSALAAADGVGPRQVAKGATAPQPRQAVSFDNRLNALLVTCSESAIDDARAIVRLLDVKE